MLFFRLQRPDWALVEVGLLWLSILLLIVVLARYSKAAGVLLVPYLGLGHVRRDPEPGGRSAQWPVCLTTTPTNLAAR